MQTRTPQRKERHPTDESRAIARVKREILERIFFVQGPKLGHLGPEHARRGSIRLLISTLSNFYMSATTVINRQQVNRVHAPKLLFRKST